MQQITERRQLFGSNHLNKNSYSLTACSKNCRLQDSGSICIISNAQLILEELESHQMALQTMQDGGSGVFGSFIDDIVQWQTTLQHAEIVIRLWRDAQNRWLQLEEVSFYRMIFALACSTTMATCIAC